MLPEILIGIFSHPFLQNLTVACDHRLDVFLPVSGPVHFDRLEYGPEFTVRQTEHVHEENAYLESQGEYRKSFWSLRRPSEKRHERGGETKNPLIREKADEFSLSQ